MDSDTANIKISWLIMSLATAFGLHLNFSYNRKYPPIINTIHPRMANKYEKNRITMYS